MIAHLENVTKSFADADGGARREVLREITLSIDAGERLAIVGPSGCGKSTLLNVMGTLDRPDSGTVTIAGSDVSKLDDKALAALRVSEIGFVFQLHHLLPQATVLENVVLPSLALKGGASASAVEERARDLLDKVGLSEHQRKKPAQLSGGERQRAAVVRALINRPSLLLADEPTGALDQHRARELVELLLELNAGEGVALVMVTHDLAQAERMGRVLRFGETGELEGA